MKISFRVWAFLVAFSLLAACSLPLRPLTPSAPTNAVTPTTNPPQPANQFGFFVGIPTRALNAQVLKPLTDIGSVGWVRLNVGLGVNGLDYTPYLAAGLNVILTIINKDPNNIVTDYGTPKQWPSAGFPFRNQDQYQQDVRTLLQPALPYLQQGRQVWVQAENEETDATVETGALYWRGTDQQYLAQSLAFYAAVKSVSPRVQVVLTSFASYMMDLLDNPQSANHEYAMQHVTLLLSQAKYDALDLHFYGCVEDIPAKIKMIKSLIPAGQPTTWISTENGGPDFRCQATPTTWKQDLAQFEQLEATQLPERLSACLENGGSLCLWFSFYDLTNASDIFSHLGVINLESNPLQKKPAYAAYQAFIAKQQK